MNSRKNPTGIPTVSPETGASRNALGKDLRSPKYRQRRELDKRRKAPRHKVVPGGDE